MQEPPVEALIVEVNQTMMLGGLHLWVKLQVDKHPVLLSGKREDVAAAAMPQFTNPPAPPFLTSIVSPLFTPIEDGFPTFLFSFPLCESLCFPSSAIILATSQRLIAAVMAMFRLVHYRVPDFPNPSVVDCWLPKANCFTLTPSHVELGHDPDCCPAGPTT